MADKDIANKIAIVGMAGRFPKADDLDQFWKNLCEERECIAFFSDEELLAAGVPPEHLAQPNYVRAASKLENVDLFDAEFFNFTPREAKFMDPQQRLLIESVYHALEDAGCVPEAFDGLIGVYAGTGNASYFKNCLLRHQGDDDLPTQLLALMGNEKDYAATRISYKLDLTGPSINVSTACSTSAVAVDLACKGLLAFDCDMAIAGAAQVNVPHDTGYFYHEGSFHSSDGHVRTFDAASTGPVFGSGVGVLVLKRLEDAIADRDHVYAVIAGSAVNNDGSSKVGFTAPSMKGQVAVVREALAVAGVEARDISYVEAHGTGTPLGDPIEVAALTEVYREASVGVRACALGSVKSNVGHLETASGCASLIKTALALKHRMLPASINFTSPNPQIDFDTSPFFVNTRTRPWAGPMQPLRAGVSSFGIGGTNAHLILESFDAAPIARNAVERSHHLLALSARDDAALRDTIRNHARFLREPGDAALADICFTAASGRRHFARRAAVVAADRQAMAAQLEALLGSLDAERRPAAATVSPVFTFPGQGARYARMGQALYGGLPPFRAELDRCAAILAGAHGIDLKAALWSGSGDDDMDVPHVQVQMFCVEYVLARTLVGWGIEPACMVGHSLGEYAAAAIAEVFSLEDALKLVVAREQLMGSIPRPGGMMAVWAGPEDVADVLEPHRADLSIAAVNGEQNIVISGCRAALLTVAATLDARGLRQRMLAVPGAFHSPLMDGILDAFRKVAVTVRYAPPKRPLVSSVTGDHIGAAICDSEYWVAHLRQPVMFRRSIATLSRLAGAAFLEVGPGSTLAGLLLSADPAAAALPLMRSAQDEQARLLTSLGQYYELGGAIDWTRYDAGYARHRVPLPKYPFQRRRHWVDRRHADDGAGAAAPASARPGALRRIVSAVDGRTYVECDLSPGMFGLQDHRLRDRVMWPGVGHVLMTLAAADDTGGPRALSDVVFVQPLYLPETGRCQLQYALDGAGGAAGRQVHGYSDAGAGWTLHFSATGGAAAEVPGAAFDAQALRATALEHIDGAAFYDALAGLGYQYGPRYRRLKQAWRCASGVLGLVAGGPAATPVPESGWDFGMLDACLHTAALFADGAAQSGGKSWVPFAIGRVEWLAAPRGDLWCWTTLHEQGDGERRFDLDIRDAQDRLVMRVADLRMRAIAIGDAGSARAQQWLYVPVWQRQDDIARLAHPARSVLVVSAQAPQAGLADALGQPDWVQLPAFDAADAGSVALRQAAIHDALPRIAAAGRVIVVAGTESGTDAALSDYFVLLALAQACMAGDVMPDGGIVVATRGMHRLDDDAAVHPAQAVLLGLGRALANEEPRLACTFIDLPAQPDRNDHALCADLCRGAAGGQTLAIRAGQARQQVLERHAAAPSQMPPRVRADRTYLITGGLGAIGLRAAGRLVEEGARHLILASRGVPGARQQEAIAALAAAGAQVALMAADITDGAALRRAFEPLRPGMPPIGGVIHAAGALRDGLAAGQGREAALEVLLPKIAGTLNLHRLVEGEPLDFFLLCSSTAALLGPPGQSNYAAANAFLDAFAAWRLAQGLPALSVNWSGWKEVGMAADVADGADSGIRLLDAGVATGLLAALTRLERTAQIAVIDADWQRVAGRLEGTVPPFLRTVLGPLASGKSEPASVLPELAALSGERLRRRITELVTERVASVLGREQAGIDPRDNLIALGIDSLTAVSLRNALTRMLDMKLPVTLLFDFPTVEALSAHMHERLSAPAAPAPAVPAPAPAADAARAALEDLSEGDLAALLAAELGRPAGQ